MKLSKIKDKERMLEAGRVKNKVTKATYEETPSRLSADFLVETLGGPEKSEVKYIVVERKNCQPRMFYLTKLFFRYEGETIAFNGKQKLKEVSTIKSNLQDILKRCYSSWNEKKLIRDRKTHESM